MVREPFQWTLDRIDNDDNHNKDNVVIACLDCNLKRRRRDADKFYFTKNLTIKKDIMDKRLHQLLYRKTYTGRELLIGRLPCTHPDLVSNSGVLYEEHDNIKLGALLLTQIKNSINYYSIATGNLIEKYISIFSFHNTTFFTRKN